MNTGDPIRGPWAATVGGDHPPVVDQAIMTALLTMSGDQTEGQTFVNELIDIYLDTAPKLLAGIAKAVSAGDAKALRHQAHQLKGAGQNLGLRSLVVICDALETMGRDGAVAAASALLPDLQSRSRQAVTQLRSEWRKEARR